VTSRRRDVLAFGGIIALIYGLRAVPWDRWFGTGAVYADITNLPPFRQLVTDGGTSGASTALLGLDLPSGAAAARRARADAVRADFCSALFGREPQPGIVPIAYFSEFQCPYCRVLEEDIDRLQADDPGAFQIIHHELPIFGPASELAARASVAAARQGRQQDFRWRFMRTPLVAEESSVQRVAADLGLDTDQLARDMSSPEVQMQLDQSRALADVLGFVGTPGLVIGRTVLKGALPYALLRQIAEDEKSMPPVACWRHEHAAAQPERVFFV
jgi:predicted DsbA family dithiol-disulfide isomerase